ncbi:MAG: cache domain-containing protein [Tenuifilaceae bacterium]|jgi:PAS domain S-box-containing protein|nr:cache domain-containing protein [Tenuifilaceae bacterium]
MKVVKPYTSIRTALLTAALTAVFFVFLFFYFGVSIRSHIYDDSKEIAKEVSRKAAMETEQRLTSALMSARAMGIRALLVRELGGGREMVRNILKSGLEHNRNYLGSWVLWEPNAFDGKDRLFRGDSLHSALGTFGTGFFRFNNMVNMEVMGKNDYQGSYYLSVKNNLKEQIVEPYRWRYEGQSQLFFGTSISVPLIDKGVFLGAVGIDIDLSSLNSHLNTIRPYQTGYLTLIANNGTIVSHIDSAYISKNFYKICSSSDSLIDVTIASGREYSQEIVSEFTGQKVFRFFYPINIGGSEPWSMMVEIPIKDATSRTSQMIVVATIILVVGLGVILFLVFNIIDRRRYENALLKAIGKVEANGRVAEENARNYREIFNSTSEAIIVYDPIAVRILDVNEVALKIFGYQNRSDLQRLKLIDLSYDSAPPAVQAAAAHLVKAQTEGPQVFEWQVKRSDNQPFWAEVSLRGAVINGEDRILAVVRDITDKKHIALELEKYRNHLEFLVKERTEELEAANEELTAINEELYVQRAKLQEALTDLRSAQEQLVQSEKLASLGVLA